MVQIIAGRKGKGKTKHLLDMANNGIKAATGSIVYLDKSSKHMYELNNRIRLINVNEYPVSTSQGFIGFICGIISQDHEKKEIKHCEISPSAKHQYRHDDLRDHLCLSALQCLYLHEKGEGSVL